MGILVPRFGTLETVFPGILTVGEGLQRAHVMMNANGKGVFDVLRRTQTLNGPMGRAGNFIPTQKLVGYR